MRRFGPILGTCLAALTIGLLGSGTGCRNLGFPAIEIEETSPDGRSVAQVRNHPSLDPPRQSLWIGGRDGELTKVDELSEDQDWCHEIAWSGDGSTVAFLVQDARLVVFDAESRRRLEERWLVEIDGYPTQYAVSELSLSEDGRFATFRVCRRWTTECSDPRELAIPGAQDGST